MGNSVKTIVVQPDHAGAWDAFVHAHPAAEYGHLFQWSRVIAEVYRHRPHYLAAVDAGAGSEHATAIRGILPLFSFKPLLSRPKLVSLPFFDQAGPLAEDRQTEALLFQAGLGLLRDRGCTGLEIRQAAPARYGHGQGSETLSSSLSTLKVSLKLRLAGSQDEVLRGFKAKLRSQINKGMKNGLETRIGREELLEPFYQVFSRNMRDLGSPVHSKKFFQAIFKYFRQDAFICLVTFEKRPVAAGFMFRFKNEIKNPWASSLRKFRHLNTNMLLYWAMIRFACDEGMHCFNMGRSSRGASTYRFKQQWGPEERPLFWYSWFPAGQKPDERPETLVYPAWRRLPVFAANIIGPLLRRRISL
jgi:FemAB-related protein (PEP-CTERM system-associated)